MKRKTGEWRGASGNSVSAPEQFSAGLTSSERDTVGACIEVVDNLEEFRSAGLVVEAIVENIEAKRGLFQALEEIVADTAILTTNTSSISVTAIAAELRNPGRVAGLHFFNPAPITKLVEVVSGLASSPAVLDLLCETATAWGKDPVRARSTPGFIVNRVARPFYAEGLRLLEEGAADAATLDAIMREAGGFRMGPFELMDLIGHDVNFAVTHSVFDAYYGDPRFRPSLTQQELVAAGWLGRKSGRGFYDYAIPDAKPVPNTVGPGPRPKEVVIEGDLGPAEPLATLIGEAGIKVRRTDRSSLIKLDAATLALSDGRKATSLVASGAPSDLVLMDLALDYRAATRIALSRADQATNSALEAAAGLFQFLGKTVSAVDDVPGMVVLRTLAMLANEGAEAVAQQVASAADVDRAMVLGVNYPRGPLEWADACGLALILGTLNALQSGYGTIDIAPPNCYADVSQAVVGFAPNRAHRSPTNALAPIHTSASQRPNGR